MYGLQLYLVFSLSLFYRILLVFSLTVNGTTYHCAGIQYDGYPYPRLPEPSLYEQSTTDNIARKYEYLIKHMKWCDCCNNTNTGKNISISDE